MNPLTSLLLVANPVVTALLTLVVFLESRKQKTLLEAIERSIMDNSKQAIETVEKQKEGFSEIKNSVIDKSELIIKAVREQKEGFDAIAKSLQAISKDQEKSVETFTGISNALTTSSTTNQQSLNNVVSALNAVSVKTDETMSSLMQGIGISNNELKASLTVAYSEATGAIRDVAIKMEEEYNKLSDVVKQCERNTTEKTNETMSSLMQGIGISNNELKASLTIAYNEATGAIRDVATKMEEEYNKLSDVVKQCEISTKQVLNNSMEKQKELQSQLLESIRTDAQAVKEGIDSNSRELTAINDTLKNAVSI